MNTLHFTLTDEDGQIIATIQTDNKSTQFKENILRAAREHYCFQDAETEGDTNANNYIGANFEELTVKLLNDDDEPSYYDVQISHSSFYGIELDPVTQPEPDTSFEGRYTSTYDFVNRNELEQEAEECFGENWEAEDDVYQIAELLEHVHCGAYEVKHIIGLRQDDDIEVTFNNSKQKLQQALKEIKELKEKIERSVTWSIEDFEARATEIEEDNEGLRYDRSKFEETLAYMIRKHDATIGISWDTVDFYLNEYCKVEQPMLEGIQRLNIVVMFPEEFDRSQYDFGALTLEREDRNFILDVCQSYSYPEEFRIELDIEIDTDTFPVGEDYNYKLTPDDLFASDLKGTLFIGNEYELEPESITLFVKRNDSTRAIDISVE